MAQGTPSGSAGRRCQTTHRGSPLLYFPLPSSAVLHLIGSTQDPPSNVHWAPKAPALPLSHYREGPSKVDLSSPHQRWYTFAHCRPSSFTINQSFIPREVRSSRTLELSTAVILVVPYPRARVKHQLTPVCHWNTSPGISVFRLTTFISCSLAREMFGIYCHGLDDLVGWQALSCLSARKQQA